MQLTIFLIKMYRSFKTVTKQRENSCKRVTNNKPGGGVEGRTPEAVFTGLVGGKEEGGGVVARWAGDKRV